MLSVARPEFLSDLVMIKTIRAEEAPGSLSHSSPLGSQATTLRRQFAKRGMSQGPYLPADLNPRALLGPLALGSPDRGAGDLTHSRSCLSQTLTVLKGTKIGKGFPETNVEACCWYSRRLHTQDQFPFHFRSKLPKTLCLRRNPQPSLPGERPRPADAR